MGRGEAVTQRTLDPSFGGSNPPAPAKTRISYIVKSKTFPVVVEGFEADPNASRGGRLSGTNGSEGGRTSEDE